MLKIICTVILVLVAAVCFLVTIAARMDPTGNINKEGNICAVVCAADIAAIIALWLFI